MCDKHGRHAGRQHVTVINGIKRCVLCGHDVGYKPRHAKKRSIWSLPGELLDRHRARKAWWNWPQYDAESETFFY